ncbi:MAG: ComEC/Rec2 family competence protein [Oscillospiraceae bacterium]|nr:ComEC/Rec2 family competence protein [Oscillospiraceae bacterium]
MAKTIVITMLIASLVYTLYTCVAYLPIAGYDGQTANITAQITDIRQTQSGYSYTLEVRDFNGNKIDKPFKCTMYSKNKIEADYYDKLVAKGEFLVLDESAFSKSKASGVYLKFLSDTPFYDDENIIPADKKPLRYKFIQIREYISDGISAMISKQNSGLLKGIIIGADENVSYQAKEGFSKSGMEHILTLSGYHIVLLVGMANVVLDFTYVGRKRKIAVILLIVATFVGVSGFTSSAIRAAVMSSALFASSIFSRRNDSLNSLGIACLVLTLFNPYAVCDLGLVLSFSSTLGIILFSSKLTRYISRKLKAYGYISYSLVSFFATSLSASLLIAPVCVGAFSGISFIAPIANMLMSPIISVVMYIGIAIGVLGKIPFFRVILTPLAIICDALLTFVTSFVKFIGNIPFAYLKIGFNFLYLMLASCGIIILISLFCEKRAKAVAGALVLCMVVTVASIGSYMLFANNTITLSSVDYKDNHSIVVTYKDRAIIIDNGNSIELATKTKDYLESKLVKNIEMYVNTSQNTDNQTIDFYKHNFNLLSIVSPNYKTYKDIQTYPLCEMNVELSSGINLKIEGVEDGFAIKGDYGKFSFAVSDTYYRVEQAFEQNTIQAVFLYSKVNKQTGSIGRDYIITLDESKTVITKTETLRDKTVQIMAHKNGNSYIL